MVTDSPYIFVSQRSFARVDFEPIPPRHGVRTETVAGHHAIWAATIPFIPAFALVDQEASAFGLDASKRVQWMLNRQMRFLYDLAQITNHQSTFELRFTAHPRAGAEPEVGIALLGKSFAGDPQTARQVAAAQWERVRALFPSEAPYYYPLEPVVEGGDARTPPSREADGFAHWFAPISDAQLDSGAADILELRKFEDWPVVRFMGQSHLDLDYIPHAFVPPIEYTGMVRLLDTLIRQDEPAYFAITLRPTRLFPREEVQLSRLADWYALAANGDIINLNPVIVEQRKAGIGEYDAYFRQRAERGRQIYTMLSRERQALMLIHIRVVGAPAALPGLIETLGSELVVNSGATYPSKYEVLAPHTAQEKEWARFNARWLEMERWRESPQLERAPDLQRLRFFVGVPEAIAAFRLPTAPPNSTLRFPVRDEPFAVAPMSAPAPDDLTGLGQLTDNGKLLPAGFRLPRAALARGVALVGADSAFRGELLAALAASLASAAGPLVIIGPAQAPSMRAVLDALQGTERPAQVTPIAPLPFLCPPPGATLVDWADVTSRLITLAFDVPSAYSPLARMALRQAFADENVSRWPETDGLIERIEAVFAEQSADHDAVVAGRRVVMGLRELALDQTPHATFRQLSIQSSPLALTLPHRAIAEGVILAVGMAIVNVSSLLASSSSAASAPKATLMLLDLPASRGAERLMTAYTQTIGPLLAQSRAADVALILATGQPQLVSHLVADASVLAATSLADSAALSEWARRLFLSQREEARFRILREDEAIWRRDGATVLVRRALPTRAPLPDPARGGAQ